MKILNKLFKPTLIKKYEVACLMAHESVVDERLEKMQSNGWEIAGEILIKNRDGHCTSNYFHIPMKRILNQTKK